VTPEVSVMTGAFNTASVHSFANSVVLRVPVTDPCVIKVPALSVMVCAVIANVHSSLPITTSDELTKVPPTAPVTTIFVVAPVRAA